MSTLPGVEAVDLPVLDDEVPCLVQINEELCGKPATWRLSVTCCACGGRRYDVMSGACRLRILAAGFPDRGCTWLTTTCCQAPVRDVTWSRL